MAMSVNGNPQATDQASTYNMNPPAPPAAAPADEVSGSNPIYSMTPAGVLQYCEDQMQSINAQFNQQVQGVSGMNNDSTTLGNLKSMLVPFESGGINYSSTANGGSGGGNVTPDGDKSYAAIEAAIQQAIDNAQQANPPNTSLLATLNSIQATFSANPGGQPDEIVSPDDITSMCGQLDTAASTVTSDQQVAMITVGQIANTLNSVMTQMSQIIQGMDQTTLKIASNT